MAKKSWKQNALDGLWFGAYFWVMVTLFFNVFSFFMDPSDYYFSYSFLLILPFIILAIPLGLISKGRLPHWLQGGIMMIIVTLVVVWFAIGGGSTIGHFGGQAPPLWRTILVITGTLLLLFIIGAIIGWLYDLFKKIIFKK